MDFKADPVYNHFCPSPGQIGMKASRLTTPAPTSVGDFHVEGLADNSSQPIFTLASIISHLTQVTSFSQLDALLRFPATDVPGLIDGAGCSIQLRPGLRHLPCKLECGILETRLRWVDP
jgi:hypothetical protein